MLSQVSKIVLLVVSTAGIISCKSTGKIITTPPAAIQQLSSTYEAKRTLGQTPTIIDQEDSIARYLVETEEGSREYIVVISPDSIKGDITLPLVSKAQVAHLVATYNDYFDQVLRIQRLIRRGQFSEAKRLIAKVNDEHDLSYGVLVLAGTIATLENRPEEATEHFRMAKSLFPADTVLDGVLPK